MPDEAMKCKEFARIVYDVAQSRQLSKAEAAVARAHAEICPACSSLLADAERLTAILRQASAKDRRLAAPERVESNVLTAFRAANAPRFRRRPKRVWWLALGWTSAAAVVCLIAFVWLGRAPGRPSSPAARADAAATTVAGPNSLVAQATVQPENAAAQAVQNPASGFVPVPFAGEFARGDSGVIVRVQLPRAALAELGYPVDETQGEGVIQADLLVSEDGWPQAVRIVR